MLQALRDRKHWQREWEMDKVKFLAHAFGAEVKSKTTEIPAVLPARKSVRKPGGTVEYYD